MSASQEQRATRATVLKLGVVVLAMFGFGFALVPLYNVFCDITGLNGKTGRVELEQALTTEVDESRWVTVEMMTTVNENMPWDFKAVTRKVRVHPGEIGQATFWAENVSARAMTGQAVPSVAPSQAARYLNKTECFCFTQQRLEAGQGREMPVRFVVDPGLPEDIGTITLSYTFFPAQGGKDGSGDKLAAGGGLAADGGARHSGLN